MASFGLEDDAALARLGTIVHALDVGGEPVPEAVGFEAVMAGARERITDDDALLAEMSNVLDSLYAHFQRQAPGRIRQGRGAMNAGAPTTAVPEAPSYSLWQLVRYMLRAWAPGASAARWRWSATCTATWSRSAAGSRESDYKEGLALAQLMPGPLAAQLAIYLGYVHYRHPRRDAGRARLRAAVVPDGGRARRRLHRATAASAGCRRCSTASARR